jgi:hypothetical protein
MDFPALQPDGAGARTSLQTEWLRRLHERLCQAPLTFQETIRAEDPGIITKIHPGPLGEVTHLDVRLPKGEFLREVPIDYFRA